MAEVVPGGSRYTGYCDGLGVFEGGLFYEVPIGLAMKLQEKGRTNLFDKPRGEIDE